MKGAIVIIRNESGDFFVHQRNSDKKIFPNLYGLGAGGHIEKNETKKSAAKRELFEETGLETPIKFLFEIDYKDKENNHKLSVFETVTKNKTTILNSSEWQWSGWLNKEKVDTLLKENKLCPDTAKFYKKYDNF